MITICRCPTRTAHTLPDGAAAQTCPEPWLDWHDGAIYSKNADPALIDKMVAIARQLHARVQGDDGEIYRGDHQPPSQPKPSFADRIRAPSTPCSQ